MTNYRARSLADTMIAFIQNYVLLSTEDVHSTRLHCKRVLEAIGASVVIEAQDGAGILKCRIDAIRGEFQLAFERRSSAG